MEKTRERNVTITHGIFSGGTTIGRIFHGVGVVIRNELRNYIKDVNCINERLMAVTLHGQVDIHLFTAYAPTAAATAQEKDVFYKALQNTYNTYKKKGMVITGADMNSKLIAAGNAQEEGIGQFVSGEGQEAEEGEGVEDNRNRMQ